MKSIAWREIVVVPYFQGHMFPRNGTTSFFEIKKTFGRHYPFSSDLMSHYDTSSTQKKKEKRKKKTLPFLLSIFTLNWYLLFRFDSFFLCKYHIHKVSIVFLIFLFHILFLLCNLAIFCHLKDKPICSATYLPFARFVLNQQSGEKENPKLASSEIEQSSSLWSRTNSIPYNLNHFVTIKSSKNKIIIVL